MANQLDARWMAALQQADNFIDEERWFSKSIQRTKRERRLFVENEIENPNFTYADDPASVIGRMTERIRQYQELINKIETEEANAVVRNLYVDKINGQIVRCKMLISTVSRDNKSFFQNSVLLHGKPKKKYFAYVALHVKKMCRESGVPGTSASVKRLLKVVSKIDTSTCDISPDILPPVVQDNGVTIKAGEAKKIFVDTLKFYGITGWDVSIDKSGKMPIFSVSTAKHRINIPDNQHLQSRLKPLTHIQTVALAEHEVGTHVRRSEQGRESVLCLLQYGLKGYLKGEEGIAAYMQQQSEGATDFYGIPRYLAASLAVGMDGTPRDFRAVYSIMSDYYNVFTDGVLSDEQLHKIVWDVCMRVFRGTTGQGVGTIYTKDIVYLEGNIEIWNLLVSHPEAFEQFFVGKYNPLLRSHFTALKKLEIIKGW